MLLDTNFIRFALEGEKKARTMLENAAERYSISALTVGEILHATKNENRALVSIFLKQFQILDVNFEIAALAGCMLRARQKEITARGGLKIKNPIDFYLAATALKHDLAILTHNFRDFKKIKKIPEFANLRIKKFKT